MKIVHQSGIIVRRADRQLRNLRQFDLGINHLPEIDRKGKALFGERNDVFRRDGGPVLRLAPRQDIVHGSPDRFADNSSASVGDADDEVAFADFIDHVFVGEDSRHFDAGVGNDFVTFADNDAGNDFPDVDVFLLQGIDQIHGTHSGEDDIVNQGIVSRRNPGNLLLGRQVLVPTGQSGRTFSVGQDSSGDFDGVGGGVRAAISAVLPNVGSGASGHHFRQTSSHCFVGDKVDFVFRKNSLQDPGKTDLNQFLRFARSNDAGLPEQVASILGDDIGGFHFFHLLSEVWSFKGRGIY
ncbi:hypothetical protein C4566_00920 [Candidatus Parcubacteria bacterium]|nr:MAG: hypothetical protein C4566_00920 [Candidatus Parcubacteria bacterium]